MNPLLLLGGAILLFLGLTQENETTTTGEPVQSGEPEGKPKGKRGSRVRKPKASPKAPKDDEQLNPADTNLDDSGSGESGDPLLDQIKEPESG